MRKTIYLPDELAARVDEYLEFHPSMTFSSLVRQALDREVSPRDASAMLKLIGLVGKDTPRGRVPLDQRQPEDRYTDRDR